MKTFIGHAVVIGIAIAAGTSIGCSSAAKSDVVAPGGVGTIGLRLQLAPGVTVNSVHWTISNAETAFSESGTTNTQFSNTASFQVGGLPSGGGYAIALTAASTDGTIACAGSANFAISADQTTAVPVTLYCSGGVADAGTAAITATTQLCANINGISATPTETAVGSSVLLAATAAAGSVTPTYLWTATAGSLSNPTSAAPVFTCPNTPASVTITLSVSPSADGCTTTTTESLTVTCDDLAPTFTNVYASIIGIRCISCHQPGKSGVNVGSLDMSTQAAAYANLVGIPAMGTSAGTSGFTCGSLGVALTSDAGGDGGIPLLRVTPGDAAASLIFEKVNSKLTNTQPPCGSPMPLGAGPPLSQPQVDLIQAWIAAGALSD